MFVANSTGADSRRIFGRIAKGQHNHNPVWSADGEVDLFRPRRWRVRRDGRWRIRSSGGTPEQTRNATVTFLAPLDSRTLLYVARAEDRSGPWLWALDVESKISQSRNLSASSGPHPSQQVPTVERLVATVANPSASLWSLPLLDRVAEDGDVKPYPLPTVRALSPRFDKKGSLFYLSARGTG